MLFIVIYPLFSLLRLSGCCQHSEVLTACGACELHPCTYKTHASSAAHFLVSAPFAQHMTNGWIWTFLLIVFSREWRHLFLNLQSEIGIKC